MGGLRFLPWVRDGAARVISAVDPLRGALAHTRAEVTLTVTAHGKNTTGTGTGTGTGTDIEAKTTALLHGPGDVTSIDGQQILPGCLKPGADNVDVTAFATIEFDRPDIPWLYTPARPDLQGRLRPWLVLVVLRVGDDAEATLHTVTGESLRRLTTTVAQLPDLAESWAWAHAQVLVTDESEDIATVIANYPDRTLSRLICPRRLTAETDYLAAVVPAFHAGVQAGLRKPVVDVASLQPAWGPDSPRPDPANEIILPVYHHWTFRTGPDGDFESLARRLRGIALPADVGREPTDIAAPGSGLPQLRPVGLEGHSMLAFEGALASPSMTPTPWQAGSRTPWQASMRELLEHADDRLTPPLYGQIHLGEGHVPPEGAQPLWLAGLNLDPRYRAAAALGTRVIQKHQEELAAAAWKHAAHLGEINEQLRRGQVARDSASAQFARRVDPLAPGTSLSDDQLLALTRPVHDIVGTPPLSSGLDNTDGTQAESLDELLEGNPGAKAATSAPFRRLVRPRGPLARRIRPDGTPPAALPKLASGTSAVPAARIPTGGTVIDTLITSGDGLGSITRALIIERAAQNPWWSTSANPVVAPSAVPGAGPLPVPIPTPTPAVGDPVTTVASDGGELFNGDRFFLATADGRLFERRRVPTNRLWPDDMTWVWRDHGAPAGTQVSTSGTAAFDRIYVRTRDNRVFEHSYDGDRWVWNDCGAPQGGAGSRPTTGASASIFVVGIDGNLHRFAPEARSWVSLGRPNLNVSERLWGSPCSHADGVYVATTSGQLFLYAGQWVGPVQGPPIWGSPVNLYLHGFGYVTPTGELVTQFSGPAVNHGRPPGGKIVSLEQQPAHSERQAIFVLARSDTDPADIFMASRFEQRSSGESSRWFWNETIGRPADGFSAHQPGPVIVDTGGVLFPGGGELFVCTGNGRLAGYSWGGRGRGWVDHGLPADPRGVGADTDPAPVSTRFAPKVGLWSSLLIAYAVDEGAGSRVRWQVGHNVSDDGALREPMLTPATSGPLTAAARATALTTGFIASQDDKPSLLVVALLPRVVAGTCRLSYSVGKDADGNGAPTGGWTGPHDLPDLVSGYAVGIDAAVADIDGDGRSELIIAYGLNSPDASANRVFYRIGWGLDDAGRVTRGWSDSLPTPHTFSDISISGIGIDVADMTGDRTPDLVIFVVSRSAPLARYFIGRGVNGRGRVTGGWTDPIAVGDETAVATADAAGIAVADVTGTQLPDLIVARRSPIGVTYRIGFDLDYRIDVDPDKEGKPSFWSPAYTPPGAADTTTGVWCSVTIADLRADLVAARRTMGNDFMTAAARHQEWLAPAQALAHDQRPEPVHLGPAAAAVRGAVEPEIAVAGEVLAGLTLDGTSLVTVLPDTGDPLRRLLAGVSFTVPAYELLRGLSQAYVVPHLPAVEPETMTALAANPRFIEAFLVGLNHEMSREMLWREFPADPRHTWFRQFWDVRGAISAVAPLTDIPPLTDNAWRSGVLGTHLTAVGAPGEQSLVLVIRGEVLRRFPSTIVTMRQARWTGPTKRETTGDDILPIFTAWLSPDLLLTGFPFTAAQARGADDQSQGDAGYYFVLREQPTVPRFGLDLEPKDWTPPTPPVPPWSGEHWDDLHWGNLPADAQFLSPYADMPATPVDGAVFGRNAADMARVVLQRRVMLARHASDLLLAPESRP